MFYDFWSGCKSRDFCRPEIFFDKSQIVCQGKLSEIPQSTLCWHKKWKSENYVILYLNDTKNRLYCIKVTYFVIFGLVVRAEISGELQIFLTSLRLFVMENYLKFRRAPCTDTKNETVRNVYSVLKMTQKLDHVAWKWHICDFDLVVRAEISAEL